MTKTLDQASTHRKPRDQDSTSPRLPLIILGLGALLVLRLAHPAMVLAQPLLFEPFNTAGSVDPWTSLDDNGDRFHVTARDVNFDNKSGAMELVNFATEVGAITQVERCFPASADEVFYASAWSLIDPQPVGLLAGLLVQPYEEENCSGTALDVATVTVFPDNIGLWTKASLTSDPMPVGTASVGFIVWLAKAEVTDQGSVFLDDVFFDDAIFEDGFETGDTTAWSSE